MMIVLHTIFASSLSGSEATDLVLRTDIAAICRRYPAFEIDR
jgi:hypothetical protein